RVLLRPLEESVPAAINFLEIAPENWLGIGGHLGRRLRALTECYPFVCHGLSLNLGGTAPLDLEYLQRLKPFLATHRIRCYSEHLSFCADEGLLYDLMPIPFTAEAVRHVSNRIRRVQDLLERRIAIENVSYYCAPGAEMTELEFLNAVLNEADCDFLLDINNIFVNSVNHDYDPCAFLAGVPAPRVAYAHIAGHHREAPDLIIDTHGADVIDPVWTLLREAYACCGVFPTLLERDFNLPSMDILLDEMSRIGTAQQECVG
ncbi:MAG: HvfB family MNIO-type RiPP peptide maturase, partial [Gammaproteobacteria bacterium]